MTKLSDKLIQAGFPQPHGNSAIAKALRLSGVSESPDFKRIQAIPRRKLIIEKEYVVVEKDGTKTRIPDLTPVLKTPEGSLQLWPLQNALLWEMYHQGGALGLLSVGSGKTLASVLAPSVMNSERCVLLVKPQLKNQLLNKDLPFYSQHFEIPLDKIWVVTYQELSSPGKAMILDQIKPDLIVADECHSLRVKASSRTRRFLRYMKENPGTKFVGLSGTISKRSIMDWAHLSELALKKNSPLPLNYRYLEEWGGALDVNDNPRPPGALMKLCNEGESVREGFRKRVVETPGIVASEEGSIGNSLIISARKLSIPSEVEAKLKELYATWQIGEEELPDAMALMRVARQIVCGMYYIWKWPEGQRDADWINARRAWNREVRQYLWKHSVPGMDSPFLLATAAMSGRYKSDTWPAWDIQRHKPEPETLPVWVSSFLVEDAIAWGNEHKKDNGIIWYEHKSVGEMIAQFGGWPLFGQGEDASTTSPKENPVIVCSVQSQGTGKNLQEWNNNLLTCPPANGAMFEQILGRTHRPGQLADEVNVDIHLHCQEFVSAFNKALEDAKFIKETQGQDQKLLISQKILDEAWNQGIMPEKK